MIQQTYKDIVTPELLEEVIDHNADFLLEDYRVLHCLLKKYQPKRFLEIGTNMGVGTKIIKNALGEDSQVYSMDLPSDMAYMSKQHPVSEGKGDKIGSLCDLDYVQLFEDSTDYQYSKLYPIDGWYIDGEHTLINVLHESKEAFGSGAKIIIWHDTDIQEVFHAIRDAYKLSGENYELIRVSDTRITYATLK